MAEALGFEEIEDDDGDDKSATDQMFDLLDLHQTNPELAAAQLIKHLQSKAVSPADVKSSFTSRADDPADWRYQNKMSKDAEATPPGSTPADIARLAGIAKGAVTPTDQAPSPTVKDMGPVQYAKDTPALPAPTKPEIDLTPNLKQKDSSNLKKL